MTIALIGATGFVGSAVLKEALYRDHEVTAIARHPENISVENDKLTKAKGDVLDTARLATLLEKHDVVASAYNSGWTNPNIYEDFMKGSASIQQAVKQSGVSRLIVIGGAGSLFIAPNLQLVDTPDFPAAWKDGALAARDYLNVLKDETELKWTYLSPAIEMNAEAPHARKGTYRTGSDNPVVDDNKRSFVTVEDLAVAILDEVEDPKHIRQRFTIGY